MLGKNITAVDEIAAITNDALGAARPLVAAGPTLLPANFAPVDGAIPIQPLIDAQPVVHAAAEKLAAIDARLDAVDVDGTMDVLVSAKATLVDGLGKVSSMLTSADTALSVAPTMLGATGPQTYVVAFLNNAELRSMGGTALSFAEVSVDAGRISLVQVVPAGVEKSAGARVEDSRGLLSGCSTRRDREGQHAGDFAERGGQLARGQLIRLPRAAVRVDDVVIGGVGGRRTHPAHARDGPDRCAHASRRVGARALGGVDDVGIRSVGCQPRELAHRERRPQTGRRQLDDAAAVFPAHREDQVG